ncbi:MAG: hypothetical protein US76_01465 [Parcubacteria group bacterium GW2011_GWA2_38_13b]|nr:MAG: hypothetical protein US76_01465 [Parcubacteria group bacterium GW2011_GWA2_38_13b]
MCFLRSAPKLIIYMEKFTINNEAKTNTLERDKPNSEKIIITGGTDGIGKAIAEAFLNNNDSVAICGRSQEKIKQLRNTHKDLIAQQADISDRQEAKKFTREAIKDLKDLNVLVLSAAIFDFQFKSSDLSKDDIQKKMFKTNVIGNVAIIREARETLKKTKGTIVFMQTRFGIVKDIETAPTIDSQSLAVREDIGNYIENKKRLHKYLNDFVHDEENDGIFVFSVIPGTVDTPANRLLISVGTAEMSKVKLEERAMGKERDPQLVGIVIAKMAELRKKFNPDSSQYDIDIANGEIIEISSAAIEYEQQKINQKSNRKE